MSKYSFDCLCVLYIKGQPSAIIDYCGYSLNQFESSCRLSLSESDVLFLPYFPKIENGETVKMFKLPFYYPTRKINFESAEKYLERFFPLVRFIGKSEIEKRRLKDKQNNLEQRKIREVEIERLKLEQQMRENLYKDWWKRSESENANLGMYNGD